MEDDKGEMMTITDFANKLQDLMPSCKVILEECNDGFGHRYEVNVLTKDEKYGAKLQPTKDVLNDEAIITTAQLLTRAFEKAK